MATLIEWPGKLESNGVERGSYNSNYSRTYISPTFITFFRFCDLLLATLVLLAIRELRVASGK